MGKLDWGKGRQPVVWCETGKHWVSADTAYTAKQGKRRFMECFACLKRLEGEAE